MRALRWVAIVGAIAGLLGIVNAQPRQGQDWMSLTIPAPRTGQPTLPAEPVAAEQLDGGSVDAAQGVAGVSGDDGGESQEHGGSQEHGDGGGHGGVGDQEDRPDRTTDPTPSTVPSTRTPTSLPSTSSSPTSSSPTDASETTTSPTTTTTPTDPTPTDPTPTPTPTRSALFGASGPDRQQVESLETGLGRQIGGIRVYRRWGEPLIDDTSQWASDGGRALFVSVRARYRDGSLIPWADIAAAAPGSDLYADMARLGQQAAAFPGPINLTFNHEPEADPENGNAADFVAAWRNWVQAIRDQGALNVTFVWTVTGYGFVRTDDRAASLYWPGDFWADAIGVDAYNASDCITANGRWREPAEVFGPALGFAAGHPSHPLVLMEWSSVEDPADPGRKAAWIRSLGDWADASPQVAGLLQWGARGALPVGTPGCDYAMTSSGAAAQAWRDLGGRSWLQASGWSSGR